MKKFFILSATVLLVLLLTSSCFIFLEDDLEEELEEDSYIEIYNSTGIWTVDFVYIVPAGASSWGTDKLGSFEWIDHNDTRSFLVDPGSYDVMVTDDVDDDYDIYDVYVEAGETVTLEYNGFSLDYY